MAHFTKKFLEECKKRLLENKTEILNRISEGRADLLNLEKSGDVADQSSRLMGENELASLQNQWRRQLSEIEYALSRIENGTYGLCEETEEFIEENRLMAIPWTRFSIEGAELRARQK